MCSAAVAQTMSIGCYGTKFYPLVLEKFILCEEYSKTALRLHMKHLKLINALLKCRVKAEVCVIPEILVYSFA